MALRLRQSLAEAARRDFGDLAHHPFVAVEDVTRAYLPQRVWRIQRAMAIFGGLGTGYAGAGIDEDDDDELFDEREEVEDEEARDAAKTALDSVGFVAAGGTCVALVGGPGSGKSTLMKIIAGVVPVTSGRVVVHGLVAPALESVISLLPAFGRLDRGLPILGSFVGIPPRRVRQHRDEIFELLGRPTLGRELSISVKGKIRKDLLVAMMISLDADIVLIDAELPSAGWGDRFRERLHAIRQSGSLVLLAARDVESVAWIADRVIFMDDGRVVGDHPIEEALARTAELASAGEKEEGS